MKKLFSYWIWIVILIVNSCDKSTTPELKPCQNEVLVLSAQSHIDRYFREFDCKELPMGLAITEDFELGEISSLENLRGITSIGGDLIIKNTSLVDLSGLDEVSHIGGSVFLSNNPNLTSLSGLEKLTIIDGYVEVRNNSSLTSFNGLGSLESIGNLNELNIPISIGGNVSLQSFDGLNSLVSIRGDLEIRGNNLLINLEGLRNLKTLDGITLGNNHALLNLQGLDNVTMIKKFIWIEGNNSLTSLAGLQNVLSINSQGDYYNSAIVIINNPNFTDLSGLGQVNEFVGRILIYENPLLTSCAIAVICDHIVEDPNLDFLLWGNGSGCNSTFEISESCN